MVSKTVGKRTGGIDAVGDVGALGGFVGSVEVGFIRHGCCASSSAAVRYFFASSLVMYRRFKSML